MLVFSLSLLLLSLLANLYFYLQLKETKSQLRIEKWQNSILIDSFDQYIRVKTKGTDGKATDSTTAAS
jgi:hypothetical protein